MQFSCNRFFGCYYNRFKIWYLSLQKAEERDIIHTEQPNPRPSIIKQVPSMLSKRASSISCDSDHFYKIAPDYNTALKESGFNENIKYLCCMFLILG